MKKVEIIMSIRSKDAGVCEIVTLRGEIDEAKYKSILKMSDRMDLKIRMIAINDVKINLSGS